MIELGDIITYAHQILYVVWRQLAKPVNQGLALVCESGLCEDIYPRGGLKIERFCG